MLPLTVSRFAYVSGAAFQSYFGYDCNINISCSFGYDCDVNIIVLEPARSSAFVHKNILNHLITCESFMLLFYCIIILLLSKYLRFGLNSFRFVLRDVIPTSLVTTLCLDHNKHDCCIIQIVATWVFPIMFLKFSVHSQLYSLSYCSVNHSSN
jgi:hypothetical protein